jgi:metal-sulfur cluster biosynthetic enzyme
MPDASMDVASLLGARLDSGTLLEQLRSVIDPELGVNIVDLGLVYGAEMVDGTAEVLMTTTTPACPIGSYLTDQIRWALLDIDSVLDVRVELTHEPRWSPDLMTDAAKSQLGWAR